MSPEFNARPIETSPIWQESFTRNIHLGYALIAGGVWKDMEELENMDAAEIHPRRINAKEVLISQKGEEFIFSVADGTAKLLGRDREFREPTPRQTVRSEDLSGDHQGEPEEPQPTESKDDAEARRDFWSIQGDITYRHHNEPRGQLYAPKEETFLAPLKYIDVARSTHTDLYVMQEKRIDDYWNVDANRCLSDSWKGFTKFTLLKELPFSLSLSLLLSPLPPPPSPPLPLSPPQRDTCCPGGD